MAEKFTGRHILDLLDRDKTASEIAKRLGIPVDRFLDTIEAASNLPVPAALETRSSPRHRAIAKALEGIDHVQRR